MHFGWFREHFLEKITGVIAASFQLITISRRPQRLKLLSKLPDQLLIKRRVNYLLVPFFHWKVAHLRVEVPILPAPFRPLDWSSWLLVTFTNANREDRGLPFGRCVWAWCRGKSYRGDRASAGLFFFSLLLQNDAIDLLLLYLCSNAIAACELEEIVPHK